MCVCVCTAGVCVCVSTAVARARAVSIWERIIIFFWPFLHSPHPSPPPSLLSSLPPSIPAFMCHAVGVVPAILQNNYLCLWLFTQRTKKKMLCAKHTVTHCPFSPSKHAHTPCTRTHNDVLHVVTLYVHTHMYVCTYMLRPNWTTHAIYYVLAAVFASCFCVLKIFTSGMRTYLLLRPSRCVCFVFLRPI